MASNREPIKEEEARAKKADSNDAPRAESTAPVSESSVSASPPPSPATRPPVDGAAQDSLGGPPPPKPPPTPRKPRFPYSVAAGKAITSPRGVLGPGDEVRLSDFSDGQKQLDYLVERGLVVKS
jgi:hypothetical protein